MNLISGANGSGKSSLLEALHCLSVGHSFRTRRAREIISRSEPSFQISGVLRNPNDDREHRAGLSRHRDGTTQIRLNFEEITSLADLSLLLPIKALTPDSHQLIQEGPELRRKFVDWGVFHVEPQFLHQWRVFKRSLIQRNQLLRDAASTPEIEAWNDPLVNAAIAIDGFRKHFVSRLSDALTERLNKLDTMFHVKLSYRSGWAADQDLAELMRLNLDYHRKMKTTTDGPHRADLVIQAPDVPARQLLSRGQQKVLVYLLHLAQLDLLHREKSTRAIVLCDDLTSELDEYHRLHVIEQLLALQSQIFVSGVDLSSLSQHPHKGFHFERGEIQT